MLWQKYEEIFFYIEDILTKIWMHFVNTIHSGRKTIFLRSNWKNYRVPIMIGLHSLISSKSRAFSDFCSYHIFVLNCFSLLSFCLICDGWIQSTLKARFEGGLRKEVRRCFFLTRSVRRSLTLVTDELAIEHFECSTPCNELVWRSSQTCYGSADCNYNILLF